MVGYVYMTCNHTSVGIFVWRDDGALLLIERAQFPKGFALPAGHVDEGEEYVKAAERELREEVGLKAVELELLAEGKKENPCKREGGTWHYWRLYQTTVLGEISRNREEVKSVGWYTKEEVAKLAERTREYLVGNIAEDAWNESPGLEPVWLLWFDELSLI